MGGEERKVKGKVIESERKGKREREGGGYRRLG